MKNCFALLALLLMLLSVAGADQPVPATPDDFYVIYVDGDELYLDVTRERGAVVGARYVVERLGAALVHPVTGKELGRARTKIAVVEITMLQDEFAKAKVVNREGESKILVKDFARPVVADIGATISPAVVPAPAAPVSQPRAGLPGAGSPAFVATNFKEAGEYGVELPYVPRDMAVADIDGDGRDDVILADEKRIEIYGVGGDGSFARKSEIKIGWTGEIQFVEAGDVNKDGSAEVAVMVRQGASLRSEIYSVRGGKLEKVLSKGEMYLRIVDDPGGDRLYSQRLSQRAAFQRGVYRAAFDGVSLTESPSGLPASVNIFEFAPVGGRGLVAAIDFENHIVLYNETGDRMWRSGDQYGGSSLRLKSGDRTNETEFRGGLTAVDFDGDAAAELMVVRNQPEGGTLGSIKLGKLISYSGGQIILLALDGNRLIERWKTKAYGGEIQSLRVGNPRGGGKEAVFLSIEKLSWREKKARLYSLPL